MDGGPRPESRSGSVAGGSRAGAAAGSAKVGSSPLGSAGLTMLGSASVSQLRSPSKEVSGQGLASSPADPACDRKKLEEELAALAKCEHSDELPKRPAENAAPAEDSAAKTADALAEEVPKADDGGRIGRRGEAAAAAAAAAAAEAEAKKNATELGAGTKVAGENEDGVDDCLEFELREQEVMFQKMFRKRLERDATKKREKLEQKQADEAKKAEALELAFDGDLDGLLKMFDEGIELECCDQHGTTILSEASAGGHGSMVSLLLAEGANPNSLGRYRRTPLWRAAYAGCAEAIQALLRGGGDPREYDEQGQKPFDVTSSKDGKNYLMSWDISATDIIKAKGAFAPKAKSGGREEKVKTKAQEKEMVDAVDEAQRRLKIAQVEVAKKKKLSQNLRAHKISMVEQGAESKVEETDQLLSKAESEWKEAESLVIDLEWKLKRVQLKQRDWQSAQERQAAKTAGKLQGFKIEQVVESQEELAELLEYLSMDLELKKEFKTKQEMILKPGDVMIKEAPFDNIRDKIQLKEVVAALLAAASEKAAEAEADEEKKVEIVDVWPISVWFNHGFNVTIQLKHLSDTLIKDVGEKRKTDGRWPFVIDPSGKTSTFLNYAGAHKFTALELKDSCADPELSFRIRKGFLKCMMYGGVFMIDLGAFDFPIEILEEAFNNLDKGLWAKLTDRSVLYSYLLPRRFMRLVQAAPPTYLTELKKEFHEGSFMDEYLEKFTFGFCSTQKEPDLEFAKLFYTIRVKDPNEDEEGS